MSASDAAGRTQPGLAEKLERVTLVRALLVTVLLTSAVVLNVNDLDSFSNPTYIGIWYLIIATYAATVGYALYIRYIPELVLLAYGQAVGDALLAGGLVLLTGGADSIFVFLFFLCIVNAANLMGREGALFSASCCSVAFALNVLSQSGYIPGLSQVGFILGASRNVSTYNVAVNIVAFYAVAILAGHLAERLGQVGTELEQRLVDVRQLRALNENIVNSIAGGLCTLGTRGRITSFNRGASQITGLSENSVIGKRCREIIPELDEEVHRHRLSHQRYRQAETWLTRDNGERVYLSVSVAPLVDAINKETGHIIHFADRTAVHELQEFAQRQKRLAAIGKLSAAIAHELRNPLTSISGAIQMLGDANEADGPRRQLMGIVLREVDRLNGLIEDFLGYARPQQLVLGRVDLREIINETLTLLTQDTGSGSDIEVVLQLDDDPLIIHGAEAPIRQVIWNLLRNASEAMDGKGTLTISAVTLFAGIEPQQYVELRIDDTGVGFDEETRSRLFEPFFTTKEHGTGLGLATVHRIVEAHEGMIFAESEENGTTFRVMLPCAEPGEATSSEGPTPAETEPPPSKTEAESEETIEGN